jgi:hypothetical protein
MRRVIIESPFAGNALQRIFNRNYARRCLRHALSLGEAPLASHLLYTQPGVLRDGVAADRKRGIDAGLAWLHAADASVVYVDRGISAGMVKGIKAAQAARVPIEYRAFDWAAVSGDADTMNILGRLRQMTRAELTEQAISFAYGNCAIGNPNVTRALVAEVAEKFPGSVIAFGDDVAGDVRETARRLWSGAMLAHGKTPREQGGSST